LAEIFQDTALDVPTRLRALWAMHVTNTWSGEFVEPLLADAEEHVRAWTVQLLIEAAGGTAYGKSLVPQRPVNALAELAATDPSPVVRLAIASAMQRLTVPQRWPLAEALMAHGEDAEDHNLPKMIWYGFEPCVAADPGRALALVQASCQLDIVERSTYRRLAEGDTSMLEALTSSIATADLAPAERMLNAMSRGLASRPDTKIPYSWGKVSMRFLSPSHPDRAQASAQARDQALSLAQKFGDPTAAEALLAIAADRTAARDRRIAALEALGSSKHAGYTDLVLSLIEDTALLSEVLPRLAAVDDPRVAPRLIAAMSQWASAEQAAAAHALASRVGTAQQMLAAMAAKKVPTILLDSAPLRRQLNELRDENITRSLGVLWGRSAAVSASSAEQIAAWKKKLTPDALASADLSNGRAVYRTTCYACHTLFGDGQLLGPDITGSNRADLDYLLSNLIEPSAELGQQYMLNVARLADGRVVSGMISEQNEQTLTFRNGAFSETVRRSDLAKRPDGTLDITQLPTSLMPAGQLDGLSENDARDLVAYLASPVQQPLPADPTTLKEWFDGSSLNGWLYDPAIWSVENGEIIGRAPNGIDHNTWAVGPLRFTDFRMTVEVKLVGDIGNSGIQVRSSRALDGEVSGLQADIGAGWWGKLYEEHGRGLLEDAGGAEHVKRGDWNTYEILLTGNRIQTALNGQQVVDRTDPEIAQQGIVALQLHSGGPTEVRFRNFSLELSPSPQLTTTNK
jgi:putative heme-binding domain-containing protein